MGCARQGRTDSYLETVMEKEYTALVRLLIKAAPSIFEGSPFALKGGTAINLFAADMPRLSVDLDLVFVEHRVGREEALQIISDSLASAREKLRHPVPTCRRCPRSGGNSRISAN